MDSNSVSAMDIHTENIWKPKNPLPKRYHPESYWSRFMTPPFQPKFAYYNQYATQCRCFFEHYHVTVIFPGEKPPKTGGQPPKTGGKPTKNWWKTHQNWWKTHQKPAFPAIRRYLGLPSRGASELPAAPRLGELRAGHLAVPRGGRWGSSWPLRATDLGRSGAENGRISWWFIVIYGDLMGF